MSTSTTTPETAVVPVEPMKISASRWRIPTDVVHKATEGLPDFEKDNVRWLQRHAAGGNFSIQDLAASLKKPNGEPYSPDTLYQVLTGRRTDQGVSLRGFAEAVAQYRRQISEVDAEISSAFVHTRTTRKIIAVCRQSLLKRRVGFIFGPPQIGKTITLTYYQQQYNHGETTLVRMPTRGSLTHFLRELSVRVKVPSHLREDEIRRRILDCFDDRTLLIVDEAHQCLMGRAESCALTLEFVREIHDRRKCGVVICGTQVLSDHLQHNKVLRQLWLRRSPGMVLNLTTESISASELAHFAAAFGLDPAPESKVRVKFVVPGPDGKPVERTHTEVPALLQKRIVSTDGLGAWCKLLEDARDIPGPRMTWGKVITAYCLALASEMAVADVLTDTKVEGGVA